MLTAYLQDITIVITFIQSEITLVLMVTARVAPGLMMMNDISVQCQPCSSFCAWPYETNSKCLE